MSDEAAPSAKLAAVTVDRLVALSLVRPEKRETVIGKIAAGAMSGADWKLEIELASAKAKS